MEKKLSKEREFVEGVQGLMNGIVKHTPTVANGIIRKHKNNRKVVKNVHSIASRIFNFRDLLADVRQVLIEEEKSKENESRND